MANGILGLPPGARGFAVGEQMAREQGEGQQRQLLGILGMQNMLRQQQMAEQMAPLQLEQARLGLEQARNPAPKWQVSERFNEATGKKEKVIVDLNNPANVMPFGGQEARNLSFQNTGKQIVGLDPTTGQPVGQPVGVTVTPHQEWEQATKFPWQQSVERARLANEASGLNMRGAELFYNTGIPGMGAGAGAPFSPVPPGGRPAVPLGPVAPPGIIPPRGGPVVPQQYVPTDAPMPGAAPLPPRIAAENSAKKSEKEAELKKTLDTYTVARDGLLSGLSGTETGPLVGRIPAVTTGQQVGEGAVAAIAPVLKQIFRAAGEGIFSDKDQELLLRMVPTRTDHPEARKAKLENIDNIISAKLGMPVPKMGGDVGDQVKALGVAYEPNLYDYRVVDGKVQRKRK